MRADEHAAGLHSAQRPELGVGGLELGEHPPGAGHEDIAGVGDRDPASGALDEGQPDLILQSADLLRQRGLGDVLARRGAGEVQFLGQRDQVAELRQFHKPELIRAASLRL